MGFFQVSQTTRACLVLIVLATILHVIGFSTMGWSHNNISVWRIDFGIWQYEKCTYYVFAGSDKPLEVTCFWDWVEDLYMTQAWKIDMRNIGNFRVYVTGWIAATQTLESLALAAYIAACILIIALVASNRGRDNQHVSTSRFHFGFIVSALLSMLLSLIGAVVFAVNMTERCWLSSATCTLGYSFALVLTACGLAALACTLKLLERLGIMSADPLRLSPSGGGKFSEIDIGGGPAYGGYVDFGQQPVMMGGPSSAAATAAAYYS